MDYYSTNAVKIMTRLSLQKIYHANYTTKIYNKNYSTKNIPQKNFILKKKKIHGSHYCFTVLAWVGMILVFSSRTGPWAIPIMYCPCANSRQLMASTI
jgi:hypothetical protein